MAYNSFNPWLQREEGLFQEMTDGELSLILEKANEAFHQWRTVDKKARCARLKELGSTLLSRRQELAEMMASEMGKPVTQGLAEIDKCALLCTWYAENAVQILNHERRDSSACESIICHEPQGIILGIMPWNFPFWQVFRFIVPAFAGGNAALLKHASNVPRCALAIEETVLDSGYPDGLFRTIFPSHPQVSTLIADRRVRGVSLTGSNIAGKKIASVAGEHLKKLVMELGGSDPFIVFPDAPVAKAVKAALFSRFQNGGQSCIAAKRIIVHEDVYDEFRGKFLAAARELLAGDPLDPQTEIGPMVSIAAADDLERQLSDSIREGARLLCGGRAGKERPALFIPAVVEDVPLSSPLAIEETFGPVAPLFRFTTPAEAVKMANDTPYGLGAAIWTADLRLATNMAHEIDTGTVAINGFVKSEPGLPFGGVKESGYGRELAVEGLREFLNIKTISIFEP
ncbi:MAG: NAD-dependent succinate-semialdehyde dehydrogenase [Bacteroidales bacterium]|nr:NAD-dependent succinate-semialdehyde dehydrogenase [Bacteroidales bacterium]